MGTLYLDRRNLHLRLEGQRLVIEEPDARPRGAPLTLRLMAPVTIVIPREAEIR